MLRQSRTEWALSRRGNKTGAFKHRRASCVALVFRDHLCPWILVNDWRRSISRTQAKNRYFRKSSRRQTSQNSAHL